MLAILSKCYQSQGQSFLLSSRSLKNLETHKESHSTVQKNAQINERSESYWGLMELEGIYIILSEYRTLTALIRTPFVKLLSTVIIESLGSRAVLWIYFQFCYPNKPSERSLISFAQFFFSTRLWLSLRVSRFFELLNDSRNNGPWE